LPNLKKTPDWLPVFLRTALIGAVGGAIATWFQVPLSWMLGALFATAAFAAVGVRLDMPKPMRLGSRVFIGLILGAAINADTFARVGQWPASLALMVFGLAAITALTAAYYHYAARFDTITATAAALPGGLSSVAAIAIEKGADGPATVMGQLFRLTALVVLVPLVYGFWLGKPTTLPAQTGSVVWVGENLWIVALAVPGMWLGRLVRLPVPEMLGPLLVAAAFGVAGFALVLPQWLFALVFIVLGSAIGARFRGITGRMMAGLGAHSLVATTFSLSLVVLLAFPVAWVADVPIYVALLAVAPGGIAEMAVLAAVLGIDPVFVTFHQAFRSILLHSIAPFVLTWVQARAGPKK
jgi:membrane AbrB-like protein